MAHKLEVMAVQQVQDIHLGAREKVVNTDEVIAFVKQERTNGTTRKARLRLPEATFFDIAI